MVILLNSKVKIVFPSLVNYQFSPIPHQCEFLPVFIQLDCMGKVGEKMCIYFVFSSASFRMLPVPKASSYRLHMAWDKIIYGKLG